ncbi:unnamed protein product [Effrenium voratum]|nr:unnamed protein product [Effrenium voratum]
MLAGTQISVGNAVSGFVSSVPCGFALRSSFWRTVFVPREERSMEQGSPPIKLSPSASRTSLGSDVSFKTLRKSSFLGPDDNREAHAFTLKNFILQDKLETQIRSDLKATKSISLEHVHRAEENHDKNKESFPNGESRLCDITAGPSLTNKVAKEAKVVTKGIRGGADKRTLLPAVLELQGEVRTTFQFLATLAFFLIFTLACQLHYRTYSIHLQEKNLRTHLTDSAMEVNEIPQMFEWLEQSWFPFLWSIPNAAGTTSSLLPSRELTLLGGSQLKVISTPEEECVYVPGAMCYDQGERAINYDPVLNGWEVGRRLSGTEGPAMLMELYRSWRPSLPQDMPAQSWQVKRREPARRPRRRVQNLQKARRQLKGGLEGLPRKTRSRWFETSNEDKPERKTRERRLEPTSSVIMDGLPDPNGYDKAAVTIIPMSRALSAVSAQLQTWQNELSSLVSERTLVLGVEALLRNENSQLLTRVSVSFLLSRGGAVFVQVRLLSLHTLNDTTAMLCAGLWTVFLIGTIVVLLAQIVMAFSNGKASHHFTRMATYIQWGIVTVGVVIVILMFMERVEMIRAKGLVEDYLIQRPNVQASVLEDFDMSWFKLLHEVVYWASRADSDLLVCIALFHILLLFQFLVASKGQPRLALLANTLEMAFQDIVHLFVVFLFIFSAFVIAGHILFGSKLKNFSTVQGAFGKSIEQVVSFKTDWDVVTEQDWWTAAIWIWLMIIVVSLVVINIVLAVIFDCYGKIRSGITSKDTLWTTIQRQFTAMRHMNKWYATVDLLTGINNCKSEVITQQGFREIFRDISDEQMEQIFELAELRAVNDTIKGQPTLLGEAIASILLGIDDMRDGLRTVEDKSFKSYRESKIWLEEHKEPLTALPPVTDMGPSTYIVVCDFGCDVRDEPDLSSPVTTRLAKGDKVEVVRTQDYNKGDGLQRLMGQLAEPNSGWIPIFDPETGFCWADVWQDPKNAEQDYPGTYVVLHDGACVKADISLSSPEVGDLKEGMLINVVEVVVDYFDEEVSASRKRGRIENPAGWISLVDRDTGYRFAERSKIQEPFGKWVCTETANMTAEPSPNASVESEMQAGEAADIVSMRVVRIPEGKGEDFLYGSTVTGGWLRLKNLKSGQAYVEPKPELNDVQDGLLCHLQRQHRNMMLMTQNFQDIQLGFEQKGINLEPVLDVEEPELPDFDTMLKPSRFMQQGAGKAAVRRERTAVNMPRPSARTSSQSLKSRLHHFVSSI